MRFKKKFSEKSRISPEHGDTRTVTRFMWIPKTLLGVTVWLEKAEIVQVYVADEDYIIPGFGDLPYFNSWNDGRFMEKEI